MQKTSGPDRETQVRFWRFLIVGGSAYVVQVATIALFRLGMGADLAFTLSFLCSTSTHYCLNRFWALPSTRSDRSKQFLEYAATAGLSYLINFGVFKLCCKVFELNHILSTAIAVPPSTVVVFLILNYRVFRKKPAEKQA